MSKKVLIIQQKMIGDVLLTSILAEILKQKFPDYQIHYLIESHTLQVVENNPYIDQFIIVDKGSLHRFSTLLKQAISLRKEKYDIVIDAYGKLSSMLMTALSGAAIRIGKHKWYSRLIYDYNVNYQKTDQNILGLQHYYRTKLLSPLGIKYKAIFPKIYLENLEIDEALKLIRSKNIPNDSALIMISLLGSNPTKTYPATYMANLLEHIVHSTNSYLIFNYMPSQEEDALKIIDKCSPDTRKNFILDLHQRSLRSFIALLSHCKAIVGNEGGSINMAKGIGIPSFAIFSPWQIKEHWNHMETGPKHVSVHLKEYKPNLFEDPKKNKKNVNNAESLYESFHPSLFKDKFDRFIVNNIKK